MNKNNFDDRFNQFIQNNSKKSLQLLILGLCFIWMSPVAVLGFILYLIFFKDIQT